MVPIWPFHFFERDFVFIATKIKTLAPREGDDEANGAGGEGTNF
jgi:hypothetical protein